jgi:hypothetical protein
VFENSQVPASPLRIARFDLSAASSVGGVWFAGGTSGSQVTNDVEVVRWHLLLHVNVEFLL